jgi:hypothetical protein
MKNKYEIYLDKIQDNNGEKVLIPAREWEDEQR